MTPDERDRASSQHREAQAAYARRYPERIIAANRRRRGEKAAHARRSNMARNSVSVRFVAFDGEGSYGRYQLLACSATDEDIRSQAGLGTADCLGYFTRLLLDGSIGPHDALVGFGLGYDFENILRDVPDRGYDELRAGKKVEYEQYVLRYVGRKFLDVEYREDGAYTRYRLQDIYPYFQTSFIKACEQRGIVLPETVYEGKRNRGGFRYRDIDKIAAYNREELVAMVKLAESLRTDFVAAFQAVDITPAVGKTAWYGPGSQALAVLTTAQTDDFNRPTDRMGISVLETFETSYGPSIRSKRGQAPSSNIRRAYQSCLKHPFTSCYFGGRIEAPMQGRFVQTLYDYDLTSAYPYAITRLPDMSGATLRPVDRLDVDERIGAYLVRWKDDPVRPLHPFPYRARSGNVYFPANGYGWLLSPELYAADDTEIEVIKGYVFTGTEGYGRGLRAGDSALAKLMTRMGEHRALAKREGNPAHRGLKLLMNSVYGKTLQKEGSRKYFNAFLAAWITSVTRSRIYELIRSTTSGQVISVMTDGVLSTTPLSCRLDDALGGWTVTEFGGGYQYAPGVYSLIRPDGSQLLHYRGFLRFDPTKAAEALDHGTEYRSKNPIFVSRVLSQHDKKLRKKAYQFVPVERKEVFSLGSKRDMTRPERMGEATYYPAKTLWENEVFVSWPYDAYGHTPEVEDIDDVE